MGVEDIGSGPFRKPGQPNRHFSVAQTLVLYGALLLAVAAARTAAVKLAIPAERHARPASVPHSHSPSGPSAGRAGAASEPHPHKLHQSSASRTPGAQVGPRRLAGFGALKSPPGIDWQVPQAPAPVPAASRVSAFATSVSAASDVSDAASAALAGPNAGGGDRTPCLFCAKLRGAVRHSADPLFSDPLCQEMARRIQTNVSAAFSEVGAEVGVFTSSCDGFAADEIQVCGLARPASAAVPSRNAELLVSEWLHELFVGSFRCAGRGDEYGLVGVVGAPDSCIYGSYGVRINCD